MSIALAVATHKRESRAAAVQREATGDPSAESEQEAGTPRWLQQQILGASASGQAGASGGEERGPGQAKLRVNPPGDPFEHEADRVAGEVMRLPAVPQARHASGSLPNMPAAGPHGAALVQRKCAACGGHHRADEELCPACAQRQATSDGVPVIRRSVAANIDSPGPGRTIPEAVRNRIEPLLGRDLSDVRVHDDARANDMAETLGARAFTHGDHIWLGHGQRADDVGLMAHEATHTAQQAGASGAPRLLYANSRGAVAGNVGAGAAANAAPSTVHRLTASIALTAAPLLSADAHLVQLDRCPGGCHQLNPRPQMKWDDFPKFEGPGVPIKSPREILADQAKTIEEELETYRENILATRGSIFDQLEKQRTPPPRDPLFAQFQGPTLDLPFTGYGPEPLPVEGTLPPDLKQRYGVVVLAAETLQVAIDVDLRAQQLPGGHADVPIETQEDARRAINGYYLALEEFAAAVGVEQVKRHDKMRATHEQEELAAGLKRPPPCPNCHSPTPPPAILLSPAPPPLSPAPTHIAKTMPTMLETLTTAQTVAQWKQVLSDLKVAIADMDDLLITMLPHLSSEADTLRYLLAQKEELEKFQKEHPTAIPIPAVFYPKNRWVEEKVPGKKNVTVQIPQAIPWRFYLYHTSQQSGATALPGEWVLVDMTSPKHHENKETTFGGPLGDPSEELFKQLNTKYRFPEGTLYWTYPSGKPGTLETTEPAEVSDWLGWIGMALAAIALIAGTIVTFGLAAPATVPALTAIGVAAGIGASGFGIASTVTGMQEKERYGLLTDEDKDRAILSIAFDIIGALTLGLGRLAVVAEAGARAAQTGARVSAFAATLAALNGRFFFFFTRAAAVMKGVGLATDAVQLLTTTADFLNALHAIRSQPGLSDADREKALVKLVTTSLLTGTLLTISVRGGVKDLKGGTLHVSGVDEHGRVTVLGEEGVHPSAKPGEPAAPRTVTSRLDMPGAPEPKPGWSRPKATGPQVDASLPEGRVEVRIIRDPQGRFLDAQTFHHPGADPDSIKIHEDIATLVRNEGEELRELVHAQRKAHGGEPPPSSCNSSSRSCSTRSMRRKRSSPAPTSTKAKPKTSRRGSICFRARSTRPRRRSRIRPYARHIRRASSAYR